MILSSDPAKVREALENLETEIDDIKRKYAADQKRLMECELKIEQIHRRIEGSPQTEQKWYDDLEKEAEE
jgi:predicted  nucleic acid-binding Zn-ribbon protein